MEELASVLQQLDNFRVKGPRFSGYLALILINPFHPATPCYQIDNLWWYWVIVGDVWCKIAKEKLTEMLPKLKDPLGVEYAEGFQEYRGIISATHTWGPRVTPPAPRCEITSTRAPIMKCQKWGWARVGLGCMHQHIKVQNKRQCLDKQSEFFLVSCMYALVTHFLYYCCTL